jgi:hypothetical protein
MRTATSGRVACLEPVFRSVCSRTASGAGKQTPEAVDPRERDPSVRRRQREGQVVGTGRTSGQNEIRAGK